MCIHPANRRRAKCTWLTLAHLKETAGHWLGHPLCLRLRRDLGTASTVCAIDLVLTWAPCLDESAAVPLRCPCVRHSRILLELPRTTMDNPAMPQTDVAPP